MIAIGIDVYPEVNILGYFESIEGLEGECILEKNEYDDEEEHAVKCRLKLIKGQNFAEFESNLKKASVENEHSGYVIYIVDKQHEIKLQYFFSPETIEVHDLENGYYNLDLICYLYKASTGVLEVCKMRINNELTVFNLWRQLKPENRQGWLEVAINLQNNITDRENLIIEINGDLIDDTDAFFCVLGESINGPGGYFGRNLNALDDCFCGDFGVKLPFTLIWSNHLASKENLKEAFNEIIETLKDNKVKIELN